MRPNGDNSIPAPINASAMLTAAEVAEHLSVCRATVYNLIASGRLPAYRFGKGKVRGRGLRVPHGAVTALLAESSANPV